MEPCSCSNSPHHLQLVAHLPFLADIIAADLFVMLTAVSWTTKSRAVSMSTRHAALLHRNAVVIFYCYYLLHIILSFLLLIMWTNSLFVFRHCKGRHKMKAKQAFCRNHMDSQNTDWMQVTRPYPKPLDDFGQPLDKIDKISGWRHPKIIQTFQIAIQTHPERRKKNGWNLSESIH